MSDDRHLRTWIERLSVVAILGSSAALAVPKYASMQREQVAAQLLSDVEMLRKAVYAFYSDSAYFPPVVAGEPAPETLIQYLPLKFSFARPYGRLEYRNWTMATAHPPTRPTAQVADTVPMALMDSSATNDSVVSAALPAMGPVASASPPDSAAGAPAAPAANVVGVTVTVVDGRVGAMAAAKTAPRNAKFVVGNKYTFLFFGT